MSLDRFGLIKNINHSISEAFRSTISKRNWTPAKIENAMYLEDGSIQIDYEIEDIAQLIDFPFRAKYKILINKYPFKAMSGEHAISVRVEEDGANVVNKESFRYNASDSAYEKNFLNVAINEFRVFLEDKITEKRNEEFRPRTPAGAQAQATTNASSGDQAFLKEQIYKELANLKAMADEFQDKNVIVNVYCQKTKNSVELIEQYMGLLG